MQQPKIVVKLIPFGPKRMRQTRAYARRHYGSDTWQLRDPEVIVEHFTDANTFESAYRLFASNAKHLGELPGVCAHFIIDKDGTIYEVVNTDTLCRHTIGLNWTAIGVESVGTSDRQIMRNSRQMNASLRLTVWLMREYGISIGNVIGHAESLRSRFYRERVVPYRCMTHSDWSHEYMGAYRRRAGRVVKKLGVALGDPYRPVSNGC